MSTIKDTGYYIKKYRYTHGLNQTEMSNLIGISRPILVEAELGKRISADTAIKISEIVNVNKFEILGNNLFEIIPQTDDEVKLILKVLSNFTESDELKENILKLI